MKCHKIIAICAMLAAAYAGQENSCAKASFIAWEKLKNPVLGYEDWSIKDACLTYRDGVFYIFFSAFYDDEGVMRSHVVEVSTTDFITYSKPILNFSGKQEGYMGMCSPDVTRTGDTYYMTFNSWGYDKNKPNRLFYMESRDLVNWSPRKPLAGELLGGNQVIDIAIAHHNNRNYAIFQVEDDKRPRIATAPHIDGPWSFVGDGRVQLFMPDGKESGLKHENFQFIFIDGRWRLLSSDYSPRAMVLYTMAGNGDKPEDWLVWGEGRKLEINGEDWNCNEKDNAPALADWREHDGYIYLIYAGKGDYLKDSFVGPGSRKPWARGWNRLGLARSKDMITWSLAGK